MSKLQEYVAQQLFRKFPHLTIKENYRPNWLQNPDGSLLELDFYIPEIKTAIEVQGNQHYRYIPFFHGDYNGFLEQLRRDNIKRTTCAIEDIRLVEIDSEQDVSLFIDSFQPDTYKQQPTAKIQHKKPRDIKRLEKKLRRLQDSLESVNRSLIKCGNADKITRLSIQKENVITKMVAISDRLTSVH